MFFVSFIFFFFFFNDTPTTEIYTLSLHDALPISRRLVAKLETSMSKVGAATGAAPMALLPSAPNSRTASFSTSSPFTSRSEEHTSELQSRLHLVCRLLLEKKTTISVF